MATRALHALPPANNRRADLRRSVRAGLAAVRASFRRPAAVAIEHCREHGYFMAAMGCADAAGFVHSIFAGLLVAGAGFLALEWRVSR